MIAFMGSDHAIPHTATRMTDVHADELKVKLFRKPALAFLILLTDLFLLFLHYCLKNKISRDVFVHSSQFLMSLGT